MYVSLPAGFIALRFYAYQHQMCNIFAPSAIILCAMLIATSLTVLASLQPPARLRWQWRGQMKR
jgi:hypothetical protein